MALGGLGLTGLGLWLQARRRGYALTLQGGGVVVLYLTVFAALRIFPVLPPTLAFVLLVGLALLPSVPALPFLTLAAVTATLAWFTFKRRDEQGRIEVAQYNVRATGHVAKLRRDLSV